MPIKLSVTDKKENQLWALANDPDLVFKNIELTKTLINKYPEQNIFCFIAGRYMCFQYVRLNSPESSLGNIMMIFFDFKNNREDALKICNSLVMENNRELFMYLFDKYMTVNYEKDYDLVELVSDDKLPNSFLFPN